MGYISYKFFPKIKDVQKAIKEDSDEYVKRATENITGIREIKALGIKKTINKIMFSKIDSLFDKRSLSSEDREKSLNNMIEIALESII